MAYDESSLPTVGQLKKTAEKSKTKLDALKLSQEVLAARMDAQVTASTESDADYAAEVVDARIDAWANENASLGSGIREGQNRQILLLNEVKTSHQKQIDELAEARLENLITGIEVHSEFRQGLLREEQIRIENDVILQDQVDDLAESQLENLVTESETYSNFRQEQTKEEESRIDGDENLQSQMDSLSGAILNILVQISEIREIIRK